MHASNFGYLSCATSFLFLCLAVYYGIYVGNFIQFSLHVVKGVSFIVEEHNHVTNSNWDVNLKSFPRAYAHKRGTAAMLCKVHGGFLVVGT